MSRGIAFRAVAIAVLVVFLAGNVFADAAAMLEPNGTVLVNDSQVTRVSTVFDGDRVKTGNDSGAMLSGKDATVQLASNSSLTLGPRSVALDQGAAAMTLSPNGTAQVGDLTLTPSEGPAAYQVSRTADSTQIKVTSGKLLVARAGVVTPLAAGSQQMFQNANSNSNNNAEGHSNKKLAAAGILIGVASGLIVWYTTGETSHLVP
ncbi:MAG: hypothetical protein HYX28_06810 [Candidatus Koribacter versatilis]|uniref:FecR protein domain-containing protein n=1 Tax=Candidatus Korobacter versatilis TaxID=658062 RepID=A0A932ER40_9BACT|nr:hypothetical protein [Candidatus Koribacter versatilis]